MLKIRRKAQDWGWADPPAEEPDIDIEQDEPIYDNPETEAVATLLVHDDKISSKLQKSVQKDMQAGKHPDTIRNGLITYFMNKLTGDAATFGSPYYELIMASLEKVSWDSLADIYMGDYSEPEFFDEEDMDEQIMHQFDDISQVFEDEYGETPAAPKRKKRPKTTAPSTGPTTTGIPGDVTTTMV